MIRAMMTAASGMKAQQTQVDTIANNIANGNTAGFKKSELSFRALLYQTYREPGAPTAQSQRNPIGLQVGTGTEVAGSSKTFSQGVLEPTSGRFDLAVQGEGFFKVKLPSGDSRYTRDGSFHLDGQGTLVSAEGYIVDGAPTIPPDAISVTIGDDGIVTTQNTESGTPSQVGNVPLFRFPNPAGLKANGGNFYSETPASGAATQGQPGLTGTGVIKQGYRERSNVEVVDELVALILAQRNYEMNSRAIRASDEMLQQVNQMLR
ncbi:MAG: flagellar basal-body rod protein FlgG [Planctomycetes bacterium]|nr:flagellar basal-body rod protein FlgG [Planctomycetota bacterium]